MFATLTFTSFTTMADVPDKILNTPIALLNGNTITLEEYRDKKPVYLKFWASWCQPCIKEMPHFQESQEEYGDQIKIISINIGINDTVEDINKVAQEYELTMASAYDTDGEVAQAFQFIGTPYHLLFDKNINLVHRGHKADESLDKKLHLLANQSETEHVSHAVFSKKEQTLDLPIYTKKPTAIYFTSTWCDWYLKETRPEASENCSRSQVEFNKLASKYNSVNWMLVVSRLWTVQSDLDDYIKKYDIRITSLIDTSNTAFVKYNIKNYPTLVVFKNGEEVHRTSDLVRDMRLANIIESL
ncbi:TlpA family protein disulfide reductase [Marinobacterium halophilum]|nr:redoxin domain-containing protein [Marinobacterium halophilum]